MIEKAFVKNDPILNKSAFRSINNTVTKGYNQLIFKILQIK